jgi:hypothetical protein
MRIGFREPCQQRRALVNQQKRRQQRIQTLPFFNVSWSGHKHHGRKQIVQDKQEGANKFDTTHELGEKNDCIFNRKRNKEKGAKHREIFHSFTAAISS